MKRINIAIDGYAGCGKSTTARAVARRLNYLYIDSGSMYRAFTYYLLEKRIDFNDHIAVCEKLLGVSIDFITEGGEQEVIIDGKRVGKAIRGLEVSNNVSEVSAIKEVRQYMVARQQYIGRNKGVVMDGRDIGTVVFPDAELKIFMNASFETRVHRRILELEAGTNVTINEEEVRHNLKRRDHLDATRVESPLHPASDSRPLDTTALSFEEQVEQVMEWAWRLINEPAVVLN